MAAPMQLTTDWITIGTSGPTVDGRNISEQMLLDAAESYDPEEYTAVISSDHMLWWFGNFGEVCKVRTTTDKKGRTALQAQIHPNRRLIEMNAQGQRLHTSMELDTNFAGTGKTYLMGLAVTDEPASLGTSALKFSRKDDSNPLMIGESVEQETFKFSRAGEHEQTGARDPSESFFKTLFQRLGSELKSSETSPQEVEEMTDEQFKALKELQEKQLAATENLASLLQKSGGNEEQEHEKKESQEQSGDGNEDEIRNFMNTVTEQLTTFGEQLEKATAGQPGTKVPANTGAGAEATFV
ncbi:GPO family capsid scaffolding protein [Endozoicomonas sp. SCSIO W0465]|uniref:GPO family capsid scaffolding protein n=1 Tax=Endozoicomonas sp. SCSIO W0465 TaxID=2918516 RepID=UPI0020760B0A|nr:GPO family capsid scaffolding protein [Endozoicomonas sp. SCSIO W0465]USE39137.1 GPO family capsid scaffolding protein [Endozoicomonas sp. SCSIO W0465]